MTESLCPHCGEPIADGMTHRCARDESIKLPAAGDSDLSMLDVGPLRRTSKAAPKACPRCSEPVIEGAAHECRAEAAPPRTDSKPASGTCPNCGQVLAEGAPHDCSYGPTIQRPAAKTAEPTGTASDSAPPTMAPGRKKCPQCGEVFTGEFHSGCPQGGTVVLDGATPFPVSPPLARPPGPDIDDTPSEVRKFVNDPTKTVHQYVLVAQLGKGGMGTVWRAWDTKLTRWVALKFLTLDDEDSVKRFEREARLAARLNHPNIGPIYEVGQHQGRHFIAMELIEGVALHKADLPLRKVLEVMVKVAQGLEAAHGAGVIHRDLKPENIMVTAKGWPYIMDFGLAKAAGGQSNLSMSGDVMGTPAYMSPEQALGKVLQLDARADIYSLGATLYVLLCGKKPFEGQSAAEVMMKVVHEDAIPLRKRRADIPEPVEAIVMKAMEKDRDRRYSSAGEFAADLERFLSDQDVEARRPSAARVLIRKIRRNPLPVVSALALLLALVTGGFLLHSARSKPPPQKPSPDTTETGPNPSRDWRLAFQKERLALDYTGFQAGDPELGSRVHELLLRLSELPPEDVKDTTEWFRDQAVVADQEARRLIGTPRAEWLKLRDAAVRLTAWCDVASAALRDMKGGLGDTAALLPAIRERAESVRAYRGEFTLRLSVAPYARVKDLRRAGKSVPLEDRDTPLVIAGLEIADYEIELAHPDLPSKTVTLAADGLKPGVTYTITGDLEKPDSFRVSPP